MRILVGTDGSFGGQAALRWAIELAGAAGGELVIASAWQSTFAEVSIQEFETLRDEASDRLDEWAAPARAGHASFRTLVLDGDPREQLLVAAEAEDANLVVVGARGMAGHAAHAPHGQRDPPPGASHASPAGRDPGRDQVGMAGADRGGHRRLGGQSPCGGLVRGDCCRGRDRGHRGARGGTARDVGTPLGPPQLRARRPASAARSGWRRCETPVSRCVRRTRRVTRSTR